MKRFFLVAFAAGLVALAWISAGFAGGSWLTLAVTGLIAAGYLFGAFELLQFRRATAALDQALDATQAAPVTLGDWLQQLPATLRDAVRLRVEGGRGGLPGPALTPYLVGLLVMLGMLGTFLGMVVTFRGTVFALERSTDLEAMRTALASPIRGLGLAFGASVAGVATSAMLGLMAAIARRERMEVARKLEAAIAGVLRPFSLVHQRQESLRAAQLQASAIPELVDRLGVWMMRIEERGERLDATLLERQKALQREVTEAFARLAQDVGVSLKDSVGASARAADEAIRPVAQAAMAQVTRETERLHARLGEVAQAQVDTVARQFDATAQAMAAAVQDVATRAQAAQEAADRQRLQAWTASLRESATEMQGAWQRAGEQALARQGAVADALEKATADFAERAAASAGLVAQLREEASRLTAQDNVALRERTLLLGQLRDLLDAVQGASDRQQAATDALLASASATMEQAGQRFASTLDAQSTKAAEAATHVAAGAVELSAVAEAFLQGMHQFQAGNDKLVEGLERMEASLRRSTARSDEQLAYYVAQAREVIDLSITSQQGLVENLRALQVRPARALAEGERA